MASFTGNLTAVGSTNAVRLKPNEIASYILTGTWAGTMLLQKSVDMQRWQTVVSTTSNVDTTYQNGEPIPVYLRWRCEAFTSGTIAYEISDDSGDAVIERFAADGSRQYYVDDGGYFRAAGFKTFSETYWFDGRFAIRSTSSLPSSGKMFTVGGGDTNTTTTTSQAGASISFTSNANATGYAGGLDLYSATVDSAFTCGMAYGLYVDFEKGAASTVTRSLALWLVAKTSAANNCAIADNETFTGNWFINQSGTVPSKFSGIVDCSAGLKTKVAVTNTANPPTQAEMVTAFGTAASTGAGFIGFLNDNAGGTAEYIVTSDGTNYFYAALTVGA